MSAFVSVGVQRIQSHLSRSRHLWGRRGASEQLVLLTTLPKDAAGDVSLLAVDQVVKAHPEAQICPEALDLDGVVIFEGEDLSATLSAARALASEIVSVLPASSVELRWHESDSYLKTLTAPHVGREVWTPEQPEFPLARLCDECSQGSCVIVITSFGEKQALCRDCVSRTPQESRTKAIGKVRAKNPTSFTAEWLLLERLQAEGHKLRGADDFSELAGLVWDQDDVRQRTSVDNHLALIFADGNGMGALFETAQGQAVKDGSTKPMLELSKTIKTATFDALVTATYAILKPDDEVLPVIPHIFGGDDVLVSVPADRAWPFITSFLSEVEKGYGKLTAGPTMSAGVVISGEKYPIGDQVEIAEQALRLAKEAVHGSGWSLLWVDVTADGPRPVAGRHPWQFDELMKRSNALDLIVRQGNSAWASVRECLAASTPQAAALTLWHLANDHQPVGSLLQTLGIPLNQVPRADDLELIDEALSIGRWWHS